MIHESHHCKKKKFPFVDLDCNELEKKALICYILASTLKTQILIQKKIKIFFIIHQQIIQKMKKTHLADTNNFLESFISWII